MYNTSGPVAACIEQFWGIQQRLRVYLQPQAMGGQQSSSTNNSGVSTDKRSSALDLYGILNRRQRRSAIHTRTAITEVLRGDSNVEIAMTYFRVSLACPLAKTQMKTPCRDSNCSHLQCFDAWTFLKLNEHKSKWFCPICHRTIVFENLLIDDYFKDILESKTLPRGCNDIQLLPNGSWKSISQKEKNVIDTTPVADSKINIVHLGCSPNQSSACAAKKTIIFIDLGSDDEDDVILCQNSNNRGSMQGRCDTNAVSDSTGNISQGIDVLTID